MKIRTALGVAALSLFAWSQAPVAADTPLFTTTFTPAEFAARRTKVMAAIGDAVAIISGATETSTYTKFRQGAQFFYLCGVEVPRAILVIDGRAKSSTLFLGPGGPSNEGPQLAPDDEAKRLTGVEEVRRPRDVRRRASRRSPPRAGTIYMPDREETLGAGTTDRVQSHARATQQDVWDQRKPKEIVFKEKVQAAAPKSSIKNLDPIVDALRVDQEPGRDRRDPRVHAHREPRHSRGDEVREARDVRVRARGRRRLPLQAPQRAGHRATSRSSRRARTPRGRTTTPRSRSSRTATSC